MIINPYRYAAAAGNGFLNNLLHFWDLGADVNADAGGRHFTDTGTTATSSGTAPDGGDTRLFTSGDLLTSPSPGVFDTGTSKTIAGWFYATTTGVTYIFYQNAGGNYHFIRPNAGSSIRWALSGGVCSTPSVSYLNVWKSFAVASDASTSEYFINGVSVATNSAPRVWTPNTADFFLGGAGSGLFVGEMCSFGIWDEKWTSTQASAWHNSGSNLRYADLTS